MSVVACCGEGEAGRRERKRGERSFGRSESRRSEGSLMVRDYIYGFSLTQKPGEPVVKRCLNLIFGSLF